MTEACLPEEPLSPDVFSLDLEWSFDTGPLGPYTRPSVIHLNDDDGDGIVGEGDIPDIVFSSAFYGDPLFALSGDGSGLLWSIEGWWSDAEILIADVDADGSPDICGLAADDEGRLHCLEADGSLKWAADSEDRDAYVEGLTACDLEGDGQVEVVSQDEVVSGADGQLLFPLDGHGVLGAVLCADLDQDGTAEIVVGDSVYSHEGELEWSFPVDGTAAMVALLNADDDPEAELFVASGHLDRYEADGTLIGSGELPELDYSPGPPCVADFDGDGLPEVGVPAQGELVLFDRGGGERWRAPIRDKSGAAGCSAFDLDRDGAYELLFADERTFYVFDGATGAVLYQDETHSSVTGLEYPVVADLDADGSAEILVVESVHAGESGETGLRVYGRLAGDLPDAGPSWPVHDYMVTNIDADGGVPAHPQPGWLTWGLFHGTPVDDGARLLDLGGAILDACTEDCSAGPLLLSVQVWNQGSEPVPAGTPWALYAELADTRSLLTTGHLPAVPAGEALPSFELSIDIPPSSIDAGFVIVLGDNGYGLWADRECDPTNNELRWATPLCP